MLSSKSLPKGKLKTSSNQKCRCYIFNEENKKWEYVRQGNYEKAKQIAQYRYEQQVLIQSEKQMKAINNFLAKYKTGYMVQLYERMSATRQGLVKPYEISDSEYAKEWKKTPYRKNPYPYAKSFSIGKDEKYRSKSEALIADLLKKLSIPFKYEKELQLESKTVFPDFTLLDTETREEVIFEHFGIMDSVDYLNNSFLSKVNLYAENGYIMGSNFLCSFESSETTLDLKYVEKILEERFRK